MFLNWRISWAQLVPFSVLFHSHISTVLTSS